jgi:hypothetical protein
MARVSATFIAALRRALARRNPPTLSALPPTDEQMRGLTQAEVDERFTGDPTVPWATAADFAMVDVSQPVPPKKGRH